MTVLDLLYLYPAQNLLSLWRKVDPESIANTFAVDAAYTDTMSGQTATGYDEIQQLLTERGARNAELGHWAIGWGEGFFEWRSSDGRGVASMELRVAESQMLKRVIEYVTTSVR